MDLVIHPKLGRIVIGAFLLLLIGTGLVLLWPRFAAPQAMAEPTPGPDALAAVEAVKAFYSLDYTESPQLWSARVCTYTTEKGCQAIQAFYAPSVRAAVEKYQIQTGCDVETIQLILDDGNRRIWKVQVTLTHPWSELTSPTQYAYVVMTKENSKCLLDRMEQAELVARIEQGKFLLLGLTPEKVLSNHLYIGCNLVTPAYVSFWFALHFHGFTEQVPRTTFVATTRRKKEINFREMHFKFVELQSSKFFGYRRETLGELPVVVADEAKAILDSLSLPQYEGCVSEIAKALQIALSQSPLELPISLAYAERMQNSRLSSRLGYLLETLGHVTHGLKASKGPVKLDPHKPMGGEFNRRWQLYITFCRTIYSLRKWSDAHPRTNSAPNPASGNWCTGTGTRLHPALGLVFAL